MHEPLFIGDLVDGVLNGDRRPEVPFLSRALWHPGPMDSIRSDFASHRPPRSCRIPDVLAPDIALDMEAALREARFRPHHAGDHRVDSAQRDQQFDSVLTSFVDWLGTPQAVAAHRELMRWPQESLQPQQIRVQVDRAREGNAVPLQLAVPQEGSLWVYCFCRDFGREDGGTLLFRSQANSAPEEFVPGCNELLVLHPDGRPVQITPLTARARGKRHYTVTAIYG